MLLLSNMGEMYRNKKNLNLEVTNTEQDWDIVTSEKVFYTDEY